MHTVGVRACASTPESPANWSHHADAAPYPTFQRGLAPRPATTSAAMTPASAPVSTAAHNWTTSSARDRSGSAVTSRKSTRTVKKRTAVQFSDEPDRAPSACSREGKLLKLALARSIVETKLAPTVEVPLARVFYPTRDEFANPIKYIASIRKEAERTGVCKIVPPKGWRPAFAIDLDDERVTFDTRQQRIHELQQGKDYGDGRTHTFRSYQASADAFRRKWLQARGLDPRTITSRQIEEEYWRIVETGEPSVEVEYANDLDTTVVGSGFPRAADPFMTQSKGGEEVVNFADPEYYRNTGWNLNNLPYAYGSLLRHVHTTIKGINIPWLYCGMLFASFCWHTEDNYMYSVNYQHSGAKKRWYGVPSTSCEKFEDALRSRVPERFRESPDLLLHLTTMISPSVLKSRGVEVFTIVQEPGDIILTFPKGYHAGYNEGFNCNEAVNFVLPDWIQYSRECIEMYRTYARESVFSHDRFIFHFGTTQNLDEYSVEDCEMLLRELRYMFHEEQNYKKELIASGLEHVLELSADVMMDDRSMSVDDMRQCFLCRHNVFFSGVICTCEPTRMSCLRHVREMCKCPMSNRTLMQWVSSAELRYAIRRVQVKTRALRRLGDTPQEAGESTVQTKATTQAALSTLQGLDHGVQEPSTLLTTFTAPQKTTEFLKRVDPRTPPAFKHATP